MTLVNLTGHKIDFVDKKGNIINTIYPCDTEEKLRVEVSVRRYKKIDGIKVSKLFYYSNITEHKIKSLLSKYDGIIVSKITAECLKELGYTKGIYITGRKFYKNNEFLGVKELCVL